MELRAIEESLMAPELLRNWEDTLAEWTEATPQQTADVLGRIIVQRDQFLQAARDIDDPETLDMVFAMLSALVTAVDAKDRYTLRHSEDVLAYSLQIARELGMDAATQHTVQVSALLHDVGKIGVPDAILRKPGRLSAAEFKAIQQHLAMGAAIVGAVAGFEETLDAVRYHHERWDGGGYPARLQGEDIPLIARLMAVADAFSAMTTDRPYRNGMTEAEALSILKDGRGTHWDSVCVDAFLRGRTSIKP